MSPLESASLGVGGSDVVGVAGGAVASELTVDLGAPGQRMLLGLQ